MRWRKLLIGGIVGVAAVSGILLPFPGIAQAQAIRWERIIGLQQAFDLVGVGNGQVVGGAPWETTNGEARVNLTNGQLRFTVHGLILAVGSAGGGTFIGLPIGTTAGVTDIKGTLVCDVDGSASGGNSVLVDTPPVTLSAGVPAADCDPSRLCRPVDRGRSRAYTLREDAVVACADEYQRL